MIAGMAGVITLVPLLAGCSSSANPTAGNKETSTTVSDLSAAGAFPIVKDKITFKAVGLTSGAQVTDFNNLPIFQDLEKKTNIHVDWTLSNRGDEWKQKKNLIFAGGDLPDMFLGETVLEADEIVQYGSQGLLMPLNDLIDKHMPNLKAIYEKYPNFKKMMTTPDGKMYSLPRLAYDPAYGANHVLYVNKKWLDKLNLKIPTTTEEYREVLKAFKANGYAENGNIPASFVFPLGIDALSGSFGIVNGPNNIYMDKDKVKHYYSQPEYRKYLEFMNSLYKEGLIDPESFTHNDATYLAKVRTEKIGFATYWSNTVVFGQPESAFVPVPPLKGPDGKQLWRSNNIPISSVGAAAIAKSNKHPEVAAQWLDVFYDQDTGFQFNEGYFGVQYTMNPDNTIHTVPTPPGMSSNDWKIQYIPKQWLGYESPEILDRLKDAINRNEKQLTTNMIAPVVDPNPYPSLFFAPEEVARLKVIKTDIDSYVIKSVPQFIINGVTDQSWSDYLGQLKKMGLDDWQKIYQVGYDKYKAGK
ncbi:extracellular solute-binding protein [Paenibacillus thalictri]|uniref:extracellular solute-binding protein n=1 Tax=Paenibacillus thalictri TaxID=2527873 RepID=UPI0013EF334E|nr:extracellular solute-binding protein [Paenibacillus thalictri]